MEDKTVRNTRIISSKELKKMMGNGWELYINPTNETTTELYNRVKSYGKEKVKIYHRTTCIRGYYIIIALAK